MNWHAGDEWCSCSAKLLESLKKQTTYSVMASLAAHNEHHNWDMKQFIYLLPQSSVVMICFHPLVEEIQLIKVKRFVKGCLCWCSRQICSDRKAADSISVCLLYSTLFNLQYKYNLSHPQSPEQANKSTVHTIQHNSIQSVQLSESEKFWIKAIIMRNYHIQGGLHYLSQQCLPQLTPVRPHSCRSATIL